MVNQKVESMKENIKKVLLLGSGALKIGEAGEFDYSGSQALKALKEEGIETILINPNIATVQTSEGVADQIYFLPVTPYFVEKVIQKEKPEGIMLAFGGQTALNCGVALYKEGILEKYNVKVLGTPVQAIMDTEDRELFVQKLNEINVKTIKSEAVENAEDARRAAKELGYPVIVRAAYALGGLGSGFCDNEEQLDILVEKAFSFSPQVLVEKSLRGWKEVEYEVVRDRFDNCITVCNMENFDPVGVHTGDSIVIAPAVTLADKEYQMLRSASLDIITELGIEGGCNCQFALNPESMEYSVIEVNPRVSRSSALASKATGYPIAKVTTKIALGYTLDEIKNDVTGKTCACFEPTLDYVVVKVPKWPFDKFVNASRKLGTQMKATGEVMSIAPCFEAAIMKAVRGAEIGLDTLNNKALDGLDIHEKLHDQDDLRLFSVFAALKKGVRIEEIHQITMIDEWFLAKLKNLADYEKEIKGLPLSREQYMQGKHYGYTDEALARISGGSIPYHQDCVYKMVDTCGAEFAAETPYFYSTYDAHCEARSLPQSGKQKIIVLGSGPIRIGQGIEFDYSSVHCVWTLKELGYEVILINNNPETVSTDFDTGDRLYFEPLCPEDVMQVIQVEKPIGVVVAFGGQTAIKLTKFLDEKGITILGTSAESIDIAEDRERFDALLEKFGIFRPKGTSVMTMPQALVAANELGYPVLLRPSYVIGGQNMTIAYTDDDVRRYMELILAQGIDNPVLVDKYMMGTELEVDCISDGKDVLIPGIMEHIERAGVHSGDSIAVYPPYNLNDVMLHKICDVSEKLALSLGTKGLVNIQYLIYRNELYVIEVNPRASRTIPYISKVTGVPMVELATKIMVGEKLQDLGYGTGLYRTPPYFAVKVPVFSFEKLNDVNSQLGPEMKSTGEVLGIAPNYHDALLKGLIGAGYTFKTPGPASCCIFTVKDSDKPEFVDIAWKLKSMGYKLYGTSGTCAWLNKHMVPCNEVRNMSGESPNIVDLLQSGLVDYVFSTSAKGRDPKRDSVRLRRKAVELSIPCITAVDTANALVDCLRSEHDLKNIPLVDIATLYHKK